MSLDDLLRDVRACSICQGLPLGPRPILQASTTSRILIAGQAPGRITHAKGVPFDDPSGNRLRDWMGISRETFYDATQIAIIPMGFCFPGKAKGGDLPPRAERAPAWRTMLLAQLNALKLTLVIGQYAQGWHFQMPDKQNLTARVRHQNVAATNVIALPHPSSRNGMWLKANPWFEKDVLPIVRHRVAIALSD